MENRTRRNDNQVLYVYDRICPKDSKKRELYKQYGVKRNRTAAGNATANPNRANRGDMGNQTGMPPRDRRDGAPRQNPHRSRGADAPFSDTRLFDKMPGKNAGNPYDGRRAEQRSAGAGNPRYGERVRPNYKSASTDRGRRAEQSHAYTYRPGSPSRGGETVAARPMRLFIDKIVNFFETVEERGRRDELSAKRQAIARKKLYEHRHAIGTALLVLLILAAFIFLVYRTFFVISDIEAAGMTLYSDSSVIAASGINAGDNLYSFNPVDVENKITFHCPYIKNAEITRTMPDSVAIAVTEDTAKYVCDIWGERVILSEGLRVLGYANSDSADGLIELLLPPIEYSVAGRVVVFEDARNERYIRNVLTAIDGDEYFGSSDIGKIDLRNAGDIRITAGGKYILKLGSDAECARKLRMAEKTLSDVSFDNTKPATIDLSKSGEASVRYDPKLFEN